MPSTYKTSQGDAWDSIARTVLGSEHLLHLLLDANPAHRSTLIFSAGVVLQIPDVSAVNVETVTPPWRRDEI